MNSALLDLTDLEWQACELLNRSEHASWVQYKLDARIDHLLVDEFQDTNPTQWRLLKPLLQELAVRQRTAVASARYSWSVIRKQSIYRFRRANPALLGERPPAGSKRNLQRQRRYPLDALQRRSAQRHHGLRQHASFEREPLKRPGMLAEFAAQRTTHLPADVYGTGRACCP